MLAAAPHAAWAVNLYDGSDAGNNMQVNLTTTVSYAGYYRVGSPSARLEGPENANGNDGDANFRSGIVGNQFTGVPVLDVRDGDYGAHFSGQFYINTVYLQNNDNDQPGTFNSIFSNHTSFTSGTRNVNGLESQWLDGFVFGQHAFDDGETLQLKVGRQTLFWGQSLLFANNGISAGQAPINIITAQSLPNPQAQQVFLPVGQAVVTYQPLSGLTLQGYYQFEWQHDFFQGAGAYFNGNDPLDKGGQTLYLGNEPGLGNLYYLRNKDITPPPENGQFGMSVQKQLGAWDLGVYALRYDSKSPELYGYSGQGGVRVVPGGAAVGNYALVYPRDIWIYGGSFSTNLGPTNVAGEVSMRRNMPLLTGLGSVSAATPGNESDDALYPTASTLMAQASVIYASPGIPFDPGGVSITAEVAMNHVLTISNRPDLVLPGLDRTAAAFEAIISPQYLNVLPALNLTIPIGITYNFLGRSEIDASMYHGNGAFSVGVTATYKVNWIASLTYQEYLGRPDPTFNADADRSYISLNLQRTF